MIVCLVGEDTLTGQITERLTEKATTREQTVLQEHLTVLAENIGKVAIGAGILGFVILFIHLIINWIEGDIVKKSLVINRILGWLNTLKVESKS